MKIISNMSLTLILILVSCSKDKNMEDYKREQLQQSISRIATVSGNYVGNVVSKIDGTNLGAITLKFQARTDISSSTSQNTSEQKATVNGALNFKSLTSAEIVFDNGYYDDVTGDFQVTIPIAQDGGNSSKLSLTGVVSGDKWDGTIEVKGQPEYGATLSLVKNAIPSNASSIEVGGTRLQQIKKMSYSYIGEYSLGGSTVPFKLSFIDRDILPEQSFYKLFSPVRTISVNLDFTDFELNFASAILDDKTGTIVGHDPFDQRGVPARANLNCTRFNDDPKKFGWDCEIQTKATILRLHLLAKI